MSRVIKFRFYSNILHRFVIPDNSIFIGALNDPDFNPMQFTGLKDKNGVEIYEGDVVQFSKYKNEIIFDNGSFAMNPHQKNTDGKAWKYLALGTAQLRAVEVIGNIYENPELLAPEPPKAEA